MSEGLPLFEPDVPDGFHYRRNFISRGEEASLVDAVSGLNFSNFEMRGVVARRRVAFFGRTYGRGDESAPPLPAFLLPLRERVATWAGLLSDAFEMALVNEYRPGAPIGWHRDAPQYDVVAGVSLLSPCRMRFRPYRRPGATASTAASPRRATHEILLEPRSAYLLTAESRNDYEHHIPPIPTLRYSITFRSVRL